MLLFMKYTNTSLCLSLDTLFSLWVVHTHTHTLAWLACQEFNAVVKYVQKILFSSVCFLKTRILYILYTSQDSASRALLSHFYDVHVQLVKKKQPYLHVAHSYSQYHTKLYGHSTLLKVKNRLHIPLVAVLAGRDWTQQDLIINWKFSFQKLSAGDCDALLWSFKSEE